MSLSAPYTITRKAQFGRSVKQTVTAAAAWVKRAEMADDPIEKLRCLSECFVALNRASFHMDRLGGEP